MRDSEDPCIGDEDVYPVGEVLDGFAALLDGFQIAHVTGDERNLRRGKGGRLGDHTIGAGERSTCENDGRRISSGETENGGLANARGTCMGMMIRLVVLKGK